MLFETITVNRGFTNNKSERETTSTHTAEACFAWGQSGKSTGKFGASTTGRESATITAQLFVPRGEDVQARDRLLRANGEAYAVVGHSLWGEDFALGDGYDDDLDELVVFQVASTNG